MGGTGYYQARKDGQGVLEPRRDRPEGEKLGDILWKVRLRQETPLNPREDLECCGPPRRREWWCRHQRGENLAGLCHGRVRITCAFGFRGSRSSRLSGRVGRGWDDQAFTGEYFIDEVCQSSPLGLRGRRWRRGRGGMNGAKHSPTSSSVDGSASPMAVSGRASSSRSEERRGGEGW